MESHQQSNPKQDIRFILSEIEVALETTHSPEETDELLWVKDLLEQKIEGNCHSEPTQ